MPFLTWKALVSLLRETHASFVHKVGIFWLKGLEPSSREGGTFSSKVMLGVSLIEGMGPFVVEEVMPSLVEGMGPFVMQGSWTSSVEGVETLLAEVAGTSLAERVGILWAERVQTSSVKEAVAK